MKQKKRELFLYVLIFIITISFALPGCGTHKDNGTMSQAKAMYRCPMHPTYTSDKPGDCPICGMRLVKFEQKEGTAPAAAPAPPLATSSVTPAEEKSLEEVCVEHACTMNNCAMNVKTTLKPGERVLCPICGEVISTANGKVVEIIKQPAVTGGAPEKKERKLLYYRNPVNPEATSPVPMKDSMGMDYVPVYEEAGPPAGTTGPTITISPEKQQLIGVKTEPVKKARLVKLIRASGKIAYDPELVVTQEEFIQALGAEENVKDSPLKDVSDRARALTDAARKKLRLLGMSDNEIAELEKRRTADTTLYLPGRGEDVWAYLAIYEYEIGLVKVAEVVDVETAAYPGEVFKGVLVSISPVLDPATRTNQVRVKIANPGDKLKPEMFVNASIHVELGEKLAVPESAVLDTGIRKIVYLSREGGLLESREVELGQKAEGYYEVLKGLSEGDIVVTSGNFLVDSESRLTSAATPSDGKPQTQTH